MTTASQSLSEPRLPKLLPAAEGASRGGRFAAPITFALFGLADILLFCWLDFGALVGQSIDPANTNIRAWFDRVAARPSLKADPVTPPAGAKKA